MAILSHRSGRLYGASYATAAPRRRTPFEVDELRRNVRDRFTAYKVAGQLKALGFKTPYEAVEELWTSKPDAFIVQPHRHTPGPDT